MIEEQIPDCELIGRIKSGNAQAADELYRRYYSRVVAFCLQYLHFPEDAVDAAQEVFFKILVQKKIYSYRGESHFWAWLKRIALNVCHEIFRKKKQHKEISQPRNEEMEYLEMMIPARGPSPEEQILHEEIVNNVNQAVEQLPKKYQNALRVRYLQEKTYDESASQLQLKSAVIGVHILRGKRLLVKVVRKTFPEYVPHWAMEANS